MAYLTLIAAVPREQVAAIREDDAFVLQPTLIKHVSHFLASWSGVQSVGQALVTAIDGGDCLNEAFWHPVRPPRVHFPPAVAELAWQLQRPWNDIGEPADDWLESELARLLPVLTHAAETGACLVTALDNPGDRDRAKRVRIPWLPPAPEHGAPRRRSWWFWC